MWLGPQPASPPALHVAGKCWKTLPARDSVSPLGMGTRESADAFSAPIHPDADMPRAESLWKYEKCPGFIFIREPLLYAGDRAHGFPLHASFASGERTRFSIRKYSAFWCSKPLRPSEWHYGNGRVIRRIPTGISTSSFTTFEPVHWSTQYSSWGWCTLSSKTCSNDSTFASKRVATLSILRFPADLCSRLSNDICN